MLRLPPVLAIAPLLAVACGGVASSVTPVDGATGVRVVGCAPTADLPGGGTVLAGTAVGDAEAFPWDREDPEVLDGFDADRIRRGGPPPDGIRPIDDPCFESVTTAGEWLEDQSPLLVVDVDGDVRGYPLAILTQHEIVNDVVGGVPTVVTYCPLCNSGLAFDRRVDGEVLDFGTSGRLFQSNLVMYDRQTRGLWTQFDGQAVVGAPYVGTRLDRFPTSVLGYAEFAELAPDGLVLGRNSFPGRDYGRNPYPGYDDVGIEFGLFEGDTDDRLPPNTRVVGIGDEDDAVAVPLDGLMDTGATTVDVGGESVVVFWAPGAASALDRTQVDDGQDLGQVATFVAEAGDGTALTFTPDDEDGRFVDAETGSTWDLFGDAVAGPLAGERLTAVAHDDTFWFVWFAFRPATDVVRAG